MSERDLEALERRLRTLPDLLEVPPDLVDPSVQAAIGEPEPPAATREAPRRSRGWARGWTRRWSLAGVAVAAVALVAVTLTVRSELSRPTPYTRIATLSGAGNASGSVAVGPANGAIEPVVVSIAHLHPATAGHYYEIWFQTGGRQIPGVAFNPGADGTAQVRLTAPTNTKWLRCWITRQSLTDPGASTIVMRANGTPQST
jgi:anti-sigma-K factor RskA